MSGLEIDFETRSAVDLRTRGVYNYMSSGTTEPLMASFKIHGGPVMRWRPPQPCPPEIVAHVEAGGMISAQNAAFERLLWQKILTPRYGWPAAKTEQFRCTAATAAAMALPRDLEGLGAALGLEVQKDKEGKALIRFFSVPRRPKKGENPDGIYFHEPADYPEKFERFHDYCDVDVITEAEADGRMVPLSADEQNLYVLSERINDRGIRVDVKSAIAALNLAEKAKKILDRKMRIATGGYVPSCSNPGKLVEWVQEQGVEMSSAAKADIEELLLLDDLPANVREAIELRQEAAKTSVTKLKAMLNRASADGRVRGTFMYHGASTGRWTSMGVNFANLPRNRRIYESMAPNVEDLFQAFRSEDPDLLPFLYGPELGRPLHLISDAIRGFIWAAPGHELVQADYSGIEGAVAAWLADEKWKVQAMFDIIADPKLPDMYRRTASSIMNMSVDVIDKKHPLRQSVGKTSELACFGASTMVLTNNGVKPIADVTTRDLLWDGVEWVTNGGAIRRGRREVILLDDVVVTPDHLIQVGDDWCPADEVACSLNTFRRAKATGSDSLKSWAAHLAQTGLPKKHLSVATAGPILSTLKRRTYSAAASCAVAVAHERPSLRLDLGNTATFFQKWLSEQNIYNGSITPSRVATTLITRGTSTTEPAVSKYIGVETSNPSWRISPPWTDATTRILNWIASTSIRATNRAIFGSLLGRLTSITGEASRASKNKYWRCNAKSATFADVYDIAHAGPRNRFTILSDSGALIVHNCGFGGGVPAFYTMAKAYGVDLDALYPTVWGEATEEVRARAVKRYAKELKAGKSRTDVLSREAWIACEIIKVGWRATNPAIAAAWKTCEAAIREAVQEPGKVVHALKLSYVVKMGFLWCRLPSGRCLAYGSPRLKDQVWACLADDEGGWLDAEVMDRDHAEKLVAKGIAKIEGVTSPKVTVLGVNGVTKKWERYALYGGLAFQNPVQAIARDLLVNGMWKAEDAGYPVIAHVYDEAFCEVPRGFGRLKFFESTICELPEWAAGLPLTAGGWIGKRYRKD